jgi:hypothetical protein
MDLPAAGRCVPAAARNRGVPSSVFAALRRDKSLGSYVVTGRPDKPTQQTCYRLDKDLLMDVPGIATSRRLWLRRSGRPVWPAVISSLLNALHRIQSL